MAKVPLQGQQKQYNEQPVKIYGEQMLNGAPLPIGVSTEIILPVYADGRPRAYTTDGPKDVHPTDWVITHPFSGEVLDVLTAEEFEDRFGPGNLATGARLVDSVWKGELT
jgi:hypothetical protein